ncbi:helix-turn-helix transcriptional regulator [Novosphingobium sp. 9U]|uniref:helix-turn-helix domain-containing protein n=1 Tax=Novosphingobium sp. 9U TaxID=2653158 RepID=UPI0012F2022D|nr:helix-turn-helix transcriptional regulator [Novosphingobium sp. 9U]VWX49796.1 conserved hypothetical protein [Novosphingobium sp. 9U]
MSFSFLDLSEERDILCKVFRAIKKKRNLTSREIADSMGLALRTYEQFESGSGRILFGQIQKFSEATDSDPFAILLAVMYRTPEFAVHCADNKFPLIITMSIERFAEDMGSDVSLLEPLNVITGCQRYLAELKKKIADDELTVSKWLNGKRGYIDLGRLSLRGFRRTKRREAP